MIEPSTSSAGLPKPSSDAPDGVGEDLRNVADRHADARTIAVNEQSSVRPCVRQARHLAAIRLDRGEAGLSHATAFGPTLQPQRAVLSEQARSIEGGQARSGPCPTGRGRFMPIGLPAGVLGKCSRAAVR